MPAATVVIVAAIRATICVPLCSTPMPQRWASRALASITHMRSQNPIRVERVDGIANAMKPSGNAAASPHFRRRRVASAPQENEKSHDADARLLHRETHGMQRHPTTMAASGGPVGAACRRFSRAIACKQAPTFTQIRHSSHALSPGSTSRAPSGRRIEALAHHHQNIESVLL